MLTKRHCIKKLNIFFKRHLLFSKMKKILLIEDEPNVVSFIKKGLEEENFEVSVVFDGLSALQLVRQNSFDCILLDIMLPDINGLEVCKQIRQFGNQTPILFLTALGTAENVALGLNNGADDYLVKPFKFIELIARINNLLKRNVNNDFATTNENLLFNIDKLVLNDYTKTVTIDEEEISLTSTEYKLLFFMLKNKNRVLNRMEILENVWGVDYDLGTNVVDVYINYLRKKVESKLDNKIIHTLVGMGYVIKEK